MIRLIREGSQNYPWLLKIIVIIIAVTFTIGMGWFGYETAQQPNAVALVGPYQVNLQEFRQAYNRTYRFYKDELKQEVVDEVDLKKKVIQSMVDQKVWLVAADDWGVGIPQEALRNDIIRRKEFQKDGIFDPELYHRLLALNRYTPKQFEDQLVKDLRRQHIQMIVQDLMILQPRPGAAAAGGINYTQEKAGRNRCRHLSDPRRSSRASSPGSAERAPPARRRRRTAS